MAANHGRQAIPTKLSEAQFEQFVLPHLSLGRRGPPPTLPLQKMFNYVLKALYMGCQWKMLPIESNAEGQPEIHYTRVYRTMLPSAGSSRARLINCIRTSSLT